MPSLFDIFKARVNLIEFAVEIYGFRLNRDKSTKKQKVLEYESEIIIVSVDKTQGHYWYFNPNDPLDKGTVVDFSLWRNQGNWQAVISELQEFLGNTPSLPEEQSSPEFDLSWQDPPSPILPLTDKAYLHYRGISDETLNHPLFAGRIFNQVYLVSGGKQIINTVFPLYYQDQIRGLELKNEGYTAHAPGSEKSRACWHSSIQQIRPPVSAIILTESPIDALSYHQLFPPEKEDDRIYVSMSGNMAPGQRLLVESFIQRFRARQLILAMDNDEAGMVHGIKLLGQLAGQGNPKIIAEIGKTTNAYHVYLTVRHTEEDSFMVEALLQLMNGYEDPQTGEAVFQVSVLPDSDQGTTIMAVLPREPKWLQQMEILLLQLRSLRSFVRIDRPKLKDFNEDLLARQN